MKWNLLRKWKQHRKQKKAQKQQRKLLQTWSWLEQVFQSGMLSFDYKAHRLFIAQPFASLLMTNGADGWINSIHSIYQYTYLRQAQQAWEDYIQKEELAAVREAMRADGKGNAEANSQPSTLGSQLTRSDIERIKRSRRAEIAISDMEPPKVEPFEFFIIPDSTEAKVEPIGIGFYEPNTGEMEVATWDEVKSILEVKNKE